MNELSSQKLNPIQEIFSIWGKKTHKNTNVFNRGIDQFISISLKLSI